MQSLFRSGFNPCLQLCFLILILSTSFSLGAGADGVDPATQLLNAHHAKPDSFAGQTKMNGYSMGDFENFYNKWKLVTVRYREDTKEMRFTYANEIAAKALESKSKDYPDGAVFGKIGFISEEDPAFKSSVVPAGAKRYQFMVRDKKKFSSTDGWGYVLLNGDGKTFNGDPQQNSLACAACHRLVPDRGYVFSEQAAFAPFVEKLQKSAQAQSLKIAQQHIEFKSVDRKDLNERVRRLIPDSFSKIRLMQGGLQQNMFEGTVNEIGPFLTQESLKSKSVAVLVNQAGDLFAFAYPLKTGDCAKGETKSIVGRTITPATKPQANTDEVIIKVVSFCAKAS
jgi:hypothetical protein